MMIAFVCIQFIQSPLTSNEAAVHWLETVADNEWLVICECNEIYFCGDASNDSVLSVVCNRLKLLSGDRSLNRLSAILHGLDSKGDFAVVVRRFHSARRGWDGRKRTSCVRECRVYAEFISNEQFRQHRKHESTPLLPAVTPARPLTATSVCRENEMDMHLMAAEKTASS